MRRRDVITLLGGAAAWPLTAHAQQPAKIPRIGYLGLGPAAQDTRVEGLRAGLRDLGYIEGKDIIIEFRWAEKVEQLSQFATEMVLTNVSVIFAPSSTQVEAARQATKTIPIVFATHADPVGVGHVASLRHPGGNITGLSELLTELAVKELEILKEAVPRATRIGVLWNPTTPSHPVALKAVAAAGEKLGIALHQVAIQTFADFDGAFATMTRERVDGFLDLSSPLTLFERAPLAELALKHRLPGMFGRKANVEAGGLMSYGADQRDLFRRAAAYIDKILKGVKPADLPVEQASKYELIVNLKTARVIGLDVPSMLLARAAEVIE
jgi:putative tryptophan/tyrosine transport system substrate-binding protein